MKQIFLTTKTYTMREIKFRAWDNATQKMISTGFHVIGESTMFGEIDQYIMQNPCGAKSSLHRLNDIVIEQYTGLKDRNGTEIYEGDIIKDPFGTVGTVQYINGSYKIVSSGKKLGFGSYAKQTQVIGNIHTKTN